MQTLDPNIMPVPAFLSINRSVIATAHPANANVDRGPYATNYSPSFTNAGHLPFLIWFVCVNCSLQLVGAFFNLNLSWIAFRHKK
jgi:hypothetical protein